MDKKQKNLRRGFIRLTLILSLIAAVTGAIIEIFIAPYSSSSSFVLSEPSIWPLAMWSFAGFIIGFSSVWALYLFIGYVIIPVIRFVRSGFQATNT